MKIISKIALVAIVAASVSTADAFEVQGFGNDFNIYGSDVGIPRKPMEAPKEIIFENDCSGPYNPLALRGNRNTIWIPDVFCAPQQGQ